MPTLLPHHRALRGPALCGLGAVVVLVGGVLASIPGYPGYSPMLHYISQLADPINESRSVFRAALLIGGLLLLPFMVGVARQAPNRHTQRAALAGAVSAGATILVGQFPFTQPLPHFSFAAMSFGGGMLATWWAARSLRLEARRRPTARWLRWLGMAAWCSFGAQLAMLLAGLGYTAWLLPRVPASSPEELLLTLPAFQRLCLGAAGPWINPVALMEWAVLFLLAAEVLAASLALLLFRPPLGETPKPAPREP